MNDQPKVSTEFVRYEMHRAMSGWGTWWSAEDGEGRQWYVSEDSEGCFRVSPYTFHRGQLFQVTISVTEIEETGDELKSTMARPEQMPKDVVRTLDEIRSERRKS